MVQAGGQVILPYSSIHKGKRKKAVPAKPKKRKVQPTFLKKNDGRVVCNLKSAAGRREYECTILKMWARDRGICCICGKYVPDDEATFEHTDLRSGGRRNDRPQYEKPNGQVIRNGVAHGLCNSMKGSKRAKA
jgi:hypothetical protein